MQQTTSWDFDAPQFYDFSMASPAGASDWFTEQAKAQLGNCARRPQASTHDASRGAPRNQPRRAKSCLTHFNWVWKCCC